MVTILFHSTIFGPIHSRRLGTSLGVNLSPNDGKVGTFDCIYCEAGYNSQGTGTSGLPKRENVSSQLEAKLKEMKYAGEQLDVITFSGNGEPSIHPDFEGIIDDTIALRDKYFPNLKISVLCNSKRLGDVHVVNALKKVDNNILKLDTIDAKYITLVNRPTGKYDISDVLKSIGEFGKNCIVQTMFMKGESNGRSVDNTGDEYVLPWLEAIKNIGPKQVMIYTIDRETPDLGLRKASPEDLNRIVALIEATGIPASASY